MKSAQLYVSAQLHATAGLYAALVGQADAHRGMPDTQLQPPKAAAVAIAIISLTRHTYLQGLAHGIAGTWQGTAQGAAQVRAGE
ncbi:MAG: hypothetical protein WCK47_09920 [bacterium]|nr:hypothetical protein [Candidatus Sumerlaeota bacterium]